MARKQSRKAPRPPAGNRRSKGTTVETGELRIIGGDWRSRRLTFPAVGGVRPTPSRVRETLFNWLMPVIPGARCLDLFAGSGVLGLEALSRGARETQFVDHTHALCDALASNLDVLKADGGTIICQDVAGFLAQPALAPFDILLMDPPFRQGWLTRLLPLIAENGWVTDGSWVYIEHESELAGVTVPENWSLHREKVAGQVCYRLYRVGQ
ncbi:16S rRNA (guanine(966)-N(2))-methyltransferase RsmD [Marinobacter fonticola]|uniref:16S rRNA (guanine(966)-N(2))-methyltransferase RsmD n=1 Tax=Marinobacter fonticola TaxID=2603215 RepID=UPI0011E75F6A|nr:16S rRNA (guanine(966)-N(2))-methyltransferase RsmD [Marinobacter fonticola]